MSNTNDSKFHDIAAEFIELQRDVARLTETISELVAKGSHVAGHGVNDLLEAAQARIAQTAESAQEGARIHSNNLRSMIEKNPSVSIMAAFVIGILAGVVSRSNR